MNIGYARVSTLDQTLALQQDALKAAGCERIFTDTASGSRTDRLGLTEAIQFARSGDTLVVWRLDRLGRSLSHLIQTATDLKQRGINFRRWNRPALDRTTSGGTSALFTSSGRWRSLNGTWSASARWRA